MGNVSMDRTETTSVEAILKDELARGNRALRSVAPVISHMLEASGPSLVSDAIVARLRGMLADIARQLLVAGREGAGRGVVDPDDIDSLAEALAADSAIIGHLYALAMEGHLTDRLEHRASLDPVLSPLLQELIASDKPATAELAMNTLAAQSRFIQSQRRMELALAELPSELFLAVLTQFEAAKLAMDPPAISRALVALKRQYDEGAGRIGLLARLVSSMHGGAVASLQIEHAGLALFVSAIAGLTKQSRDLAVFACHEGQSARLAISLRAAGLGAEGIETQLILLGSGGGLPADMASMPPERAQALLSSGEFERDTFEVAL
ncbi:MAG: hypothetical protein ACX930_02090 [Erythrobacter sp.]